MNTRNQSAGQWRALLSPVKRIGIVGALGALAITACQGAGPTHGATATTSGGTAQYDDGYRAGYADGSRRAGGTDAVATTPCGTSRVGSEAAAIAADEACLRAEEADLARRGGPIPADPADPIAPTGTSSAPARP